jgi:hypothetical protein
MAWKLEIWWGYSSKCAKAVFNEEFDTKAEGLTRAEEVLADGYTVSDPGSHQHSPPGGITHVDLYELSEE